ncbi:hypothetical protein [Mucilaginibacter auburnensis]|uniref:Uncharacterized protein n=1 Tax=Mucilaginibacter auburnensis TaxID=1457233 RepID=A0A2H9VU62_9SPHI|nr:hypothetical protein [Mucilaginibacter auburnensis]PJJ84345.1 hypothetical protein CLV57_1356 [Mucilaginibacter auburnensis]
MTFNLSNIFQKKPFNEPLLDLASPLWNALEGGYKGSFYNPSGALLRLETATTKHEADHVYQELWNELHHQGDVGLASYYAVPHLVRITKEKKSVDENVLGLVSVIEIERHRNNNPALPKALVLSYESALKDLVGLAQEFLNNELELSIISVALAAIAVGKGQIKLGNAILNLDSEDMIDEIFENF